MKKIVFLGFLVSLCYFSPVNAQENNVPNAADLQKIYESLEYNTLAFDDLKKKWIVNDPTFIREVYNRFVVRNKLRIDGKKVPLDVVKTKSQEIYDGKIVIDIRKRYYDDEIEHFAFIPESEVHKQDPKYAFDPVKDGFLLRDIVGEKIYDKIRTQSYYFSNLTKEEFDTKNGYFFDLNLNLLEPRVMYWNTTSNFRNKYLLSMFGKYGNDYLFLPGWQLGDYVVGSSLTYYQNISSNPQNFTYDLRLGLVLPAGNPFVSTYAPKRLYVTGQGVYMKITGDPLRFFDTDWEDFQMTIETKYVATEYTSKELGLKDSTEIWSNRTYLVVEGRKRNLFNLFDFGMLEVAAGFSTMDINKYLARTNTKKLVDLQKNKDFLNKFTHHLFTEVGVSRTGGLIQHNFAMLFGFSSDGYLFAGIKSRVMVSDNFGFDLRIVNALTDDKKFPQYRMTENIVFSPVLRINY